MRKSSEEAFLVSFWLTSSSNDRESTITLPFTDDRIKLFCLPLHGSIEDLGVIKTHQHIIQLSLDLGLGFLNLVELSIEIVSCRFSFSKTSSELHFGHLKFFSLGHSFSLIFPAPHISISLTLGHLAKDVLPSR